MVLAYHVIFGAYGFWLPNDPRGSNSSLVGALHLRSFGVASKVEHRRSVAGVPHNAALRAAAKRALRYPSVVFSGEQARCVVKGFAQFVQTTGCTIHACAILPQHVHLIVARHTYPIEQLVNLLKGAATRQLIREGLHPLAGFAEKDGSLPTPWGGRCRRVYLNSPWEILHRIDYVQNNPVRDGKPRQHWFFVRPYVVPVILSVSPLPEGQRWSRLTI